MVKAKWLEGGFELFSVELLSIHVYDSFEGKITKN